MNHSNTTLIACHDVDLGAAAVRTIGTIAYCAECAEGFLGPIRKRVDARTIADESGIGSGKPMLARPDMGPTDYNLACTVCIATWVGEPWDTCSWCITRVEAIVDAQRAVLLRPDLPAEHAADWLRALEVWSERLAHGVKSGLIAEHEARAAWDRRVPNVA